MNWEKYFTLDVVTLHQDMLKACDENDINKLNFLLFDSHLNGHSLISRRIQVQDYFSTQVCRNNNYELLQLIFDKNKVPNGVALSVDELSYAVSYITDVRIIDLLIEKLVLSKDNFDDDSITSPEIEFVSDALDASIMEKNLLVFSYLLENYAHILSEETNYQKDFVKLIYQYQASDIAAYLFNSPFYQFSLENLKVNDLLRNYKENTPVWNVILTQTSLLERDEVCNEITKRLNKNELTILNHQINKVKLSKRLHEDLAHQEKTTAPKI